MTFRSTDELTNAVDDARIFAGLHYRTACVRGGALGMKVAKYVSRHYFQPVNGNLKYEFQFRLKLTAFEGE
jgi:hypothetical protein